MRTLRKQTAILVFLGGDDISLTAHTSLILICWHGDENMKHSANNVVVRTVITEPPFSN